MPEYRASITKENAIYYGWPDIGLVDITLYIRRNYRNWSVIRGRVLRICVSSRVSLFLSSAISISLHPPRDHDKTELREKDRYLPTAVTGTAGKTIFADRLPADMYTTGK